MSENTATENATVEAETAPVWTPTDALGTSLFTVLSEQVENYNVGRRRLDAQDGDLTPLLEDARRNSDDPKVIKMRDKYDALISESEDLIAKMNEYLKDSLSQEKMTDDEKESLKAELDALRKAIREGISAAENFPQTKGLGSALPTLVGSRSKGTGSKAAGETRRPRVGTIYVDGVPATKEVERTIDGKKEKVIVSTFTYAAQKMNCKPTDIHAAYFAAAGTDDMEKAANSVEFAMSVGDKNYLVRVDK